MPMTVTDYENILRKLVEQKPELKPVILDLLLGIPTASSIPTPLPQGLQHSLNGKYNVVSARDCQTFQNGLDNRILHGCVFPPIAVTFLLQGKKLNAIKEVKTLNKCDLKTAKDAVEVAASYLYNTPNPYYP